MKANKRIFTRECTLLWPFGHQKGKKKMVCAFNLWPLSITEYFTQDSP